MSDTTNPDQRITVALISEVFWEDDGVDRLRSLLESARERGADLAVLPELPLNPWSAATSTPVDDDCEPPEGPRWRVQQDLAAEVGIGLVGGAIVVGGDGRRRNTALVFSVKGALVGTWEKAHIPAEPGFGIRSLRAVVTSRLRSRVWACQ